MSCNNIYVSKGQCCALHFFAHFIDVTFGSRVADDLVRHAVPQNILFCKTNIPGYFSSL